MKCAVWLASIIIALPFMAGAQSSDHRAVIGAIPDDATRAEFSGRLGTSLPELPAGFGMADERSDGKPFRPFTIVQGESPAMGSPRSVMAERSASFTDFSILGDGLESYNGPVKLDEVVPGLVIARFPDDPDKAIEIRLGTGTGAGHSLERLLERGTGGAQPAELDYNRNVTRSRELNQSLILSKDDALAYAKIDEGSGTPHLKTFDRIDLTVRQERDGIVFDLGGVNAIVGEDETARLPFGDTDIEVYVRYNMYTNDDDMNSYYEGSPYKVEYTVRRVPVTE